MYQMKSQRESIVKKNSKEDEMFRTVGDMESMVKSVLGKRLIGVKYLENEILFAFRSGDSMAIISVTVEDGYEAVPLTLGMVYPLDEKDGWVVLADETGIDK